MRYQVRLFVVGLVALAAHPSFGQVIDATRTYGAAGRTGPGVASGSPLNAGARFRGNVSPPVARGALGPPSFPLLPVAPGMGAGPAPAANAGLLYSPEMSFFAEMLPFMAGAAAGANAAMAYPPQMPIYPDFLSPVLPADEMEAGIDAGDLASLSVPQNIRPFTALRDEINRTRSSQRSGLADRVRAELMKRLAGEACCAFTPAWYKAHPQAWQGGELAGDFDAWKTASWAEVAAWMGKMPTEINYAFAFDKFGYPQVYQDGLPVGEIARYREGASKLAEAAAAVPKTREWLPLGVFGLVPSSGPTGTLLLQLSVNKDGAIRGSYLNLGTGASESLEGAADRETQLVAWTVGSGKAIVMQSALSSLTRDQATLLAHLADGWTRIWSMVRLKDRPNRSGKPTNAPAAPTAGPPAGPPSP